MNHNLWLVPQKLQVLRDFFFYPLCSKGTLILTSSSGVFIVFLADRCFFLFILIYYFNVIFGIENKNILIIFSGKYFFLNYYSSSYNNVIFIMFWKGVIFILLIELFIFLSCVRAPSKSSEVWLCYQQAHQAMLVFKLGECRAHQCSIPTPIGWYNKRSNHISVFRILTNQIRATQEYSHCTFLLGHLIAYAPDH